MENLYRLAYTVSEWNIRYYAMFLFGTSWFLWKVSVRLTYDPGDCCFSFYFVKLRILSKISSAFILKVVQFLLEETLESLHVTCKSYRWVWEFRSLLHLHEIHQNSWTLPVGTPWETHRHVSTFCYCQCLSVKKKKTCINKHQSEWSKSSRHM